MPRDETGCAAMEMAKMTTYRLPLLAAAACVASPLAAVAQTYTVSATQPDIGTVTSGLNGDTTWRINPTTSSVTKTGNGTGARLTNTSTRSTVSIKCTGGQCNSSTITMTVSASGSLSGRAKAVHTFTVADGSADATQSGGGWTVAGISNGQTRTVYLGMDFPIADASSSGATGTALSGFTVRVQRSDDATKNATGAQSARATVIRPLAMTNQSDLLFGKVVRGDGSVTINQDTGKRTVGGTVAEVLSSASSRAAFKVTGETGRQINVSAPGSVTMTGPGPMTITLFKNFGSTINLQQPQGGPTGSGEYTLGVGGQVLLSSSTATGTYSGSFLVTVNYQ
jgi:hypothetical protein